MGSNGGGEGEFPSRTWKRTAKGRWSTPYNTDSAEWCREPSEEGLHALVCGTYECRDLDGGGQHRDGSVFIVTVDPAGFADDSEEDGAGAVEAETGESGAEEGKSCGAGGDRGGVHSHDLESGVFDLCFSPWDRTLLGCARAGGGVSLHRVVWRDSAADAADAAGSRVARLEDVAAVDLPDPIDSSQTLTTAIDWDDVCGERLAVTTSGGGFVVYDAAAPAGLAVADCSADDSSGGTLAWDAHDFEAWSCEFAAGSRDVFYTGGDDCRFRVWDIRAGLQSAQLTNRTHGMGVCAIRALKSSRVGDAASGGEHTVATGCYDEILRIWDARAMRRPVSETPCGGGVWRIKWMPSAASHSPDAAAAALETQDKPRPRPLALIARMYSGFCVADTGSDGDGGHVVSAYDGHPESDLAYGVDWGPVINNRGTRLVATSAFCHGISLQVSTFTP